jgi:hypothetical protein
MRAWVAVAVLLATVSCTDDPGGQDVDIVAGGGSAGDIDGFVSDLDVRDGRFALVGESEETPTLWTGGDEDLEALPLDGQTFPTGVAVGSTGVVYVLDDAGIWRVEGGQAGLEVADDDAVAAGVVDQPGDIEAIAVDDEDRLLWTAQVVDERAGSERLLHVVRRLEGGQVTDVAGTTSTPAGLSDEDIFAAQENPPAGSQAIGFPLMSPTAAYDLAADATGVYLLGAGYVLQVSPDGELSRVLGAEGRDVPGAPFDDSTPALEQGFVVSERGLSVGDGTIAVLDESLRDEVDADGGFDWTGDFSDSEQALVDRVMSPQDDGDPPYEFGGVAVVAKDGEATTALAHVGAVAVDDGFVYGVGQAGRGEQPGAEAALLVRVPVEDWP